MTRKKRVITVFTFLLLLLLSGLAAAPPATSGTGASSTPLIVIRKVDPEITTIFAREVIVDNVSIVKVREDGTVLEAFNVTKSPERGTATTYTFRPAKSLSGGSYLFIISITTLSGNKQTYEEDFVIDHVGTDIKVFEPRLGVSSRQDFRFSILTMREGNRVNSRCKYSLFPAASYSSAGLRSFDIPADGSPAKIHTITDFTSVFTVVPDYPDAYLYLYCIDDLGIEIKKTVQPRVDTIPPDAPAVTLDPGLWAEFPLDGPFYTVVTAETSEPAICKYHIIDHEVPDADLAAGETSTGDVPGYGSMALFPTYDRFNESAFSTSASVRIDLPDQHEVNYTIFVMCEDKAGLLSEMSTAVLPVSLTSPLGIIVTSPPRFTKESDVVLEFTTKKTAACRYEDHEGAVTVISDALNPQKEHTAGYGTLDDGEYIVTIQCNSSRAGILQGEELEYVFMVDTTPPAPPNITAASLVTCSEGSFPETMGITFASADDGSGLPAPPGTPYYYRLAGVQTAFTPNEGRLPAIVETEDGIPLTLTPRKTVKLDAIAQDNAGVNSTVSSVNLLYDPGHYDCLEHEPPRLTLTEWHALGYANVTLNCDDDSECDNSTYRYGISGGMGNCTPSLPYDEVIHVTSTQYVCAYAEDTVGNNASKYQKVMIKQQQSCSNTRKDGDETDVDCGGSCGGTCKAGKQCIGNDDCATAYCTLNSTCAVATCTDSVKNQHETDVDCGGECGPCAAGKACKLDADCTPGLCDPIKKMCTESTCTDKKKGAGETDVDCGGACTAKCAVSKGCKLNTDCLSNYCSTFYHTCQASANGTALPPTESPGTSITGILLDVLWYGIGFLLIIGGNAYLAYKREGKRKNKKPPVMTTAAPSTVLRTRQAAAPQRPSPQAKASRKQWEQRTRQRIEQRQGLFKVFDAPRQQRPAAGAPAAGHMPQRISPTPKKEGKEETAMAGLGWLSLDEIQRRLSPRQSKQSQPQKQEPGMKELRREQNADFDRLERMRKSNDVFDALEKMKGSVQKKVGGLLDDLRDIGEEPKKKKDGRRR